MPSWEVRAEAEKDDTLSLVEDSEVDEKERFANGSRTRCSQHLQPTCLFCDVLLFFFLGRAKQRHLILSDDVCNLHTLHILMAICSVILQFVIMITTF